MTKKGLLILILAALVAGGAFAQRNLSVGLGGDFTASFGALSGGKMEQGKSDLGFYAFFDWLYVEVDAGLQFGSLEIGGEKIDVTYLTLATYAKWPIKLGQGFTLSPMFGVQLDIGLSQKLNGVDVTIGNYSLADTLNRAWIKVGASADINLTDRLFLRPACFYSINFGTQYLWDLEGNSLPFIIPFYHGLDIRVAVGFRF